MTDFSAARADMKPQPPEQCANIARKSEQAPATGGDAMHEAANLVFRIEAAGALEYEGSNFERWKETARRIAPALRAALANHSPDAGGVGEAGLTDAELQAGRRVRAFAKSPHCTIEDHDQIMTVLDALERCAKGFNALRPVPRGEG